MKTYKLVFFNIFVIFIFWSQNVFGEDNLYLKTLEEAICAYKSGNKNEAANLIKKCVIIDRNNYLAWYWGGMMSDQEEAIVNFDQAIELAPNEPDAYAMRGYLKLRKADSTLDNNYMEGMKDISKVLNLDFNNIPAWNNNYREGMKDISKALSLDFNNIPACYYKAGDLIKSDNIRDAIPYLQRILENKTLENQPLYKTYLVNYQEKSHVSLSKIYQQLQSYDTALEHINNAIKNILSISDDLQSKNDLYNYYLLRYEINKIVNKENAIKDIDKMIELKPSLVSILICQIDLLIDLNKREEASRIVTEILMKSPTDSDEYIWCVYCLATKLDQIEDAMIAINKCNETNLINQQSNNLISEDDLHTFYIVRSHLNMKNKEFNKAYEDITKAIKLFPKIPNTYLLRAKILYKLDKLNEAQKDLEFFLEISN